MGEYIEFLQTFLRINLFFTLNYNPNSLCISGVVLSTFIFSKVLSISDPVIGFIGGLSQVGGDTLFAFAYTTPMVYGGGATESST